jgi:hypothetical protein
MPMQPEQGTAMKWGRSPNDNQCQFAVCNGALLRLWAGTRLTTPSEGRAEQSGVFLEVLVDSGDEASDSSNAWVDVAAPWVYWTKPEGGDGSGVDFPTTAERDQEIELVFGQVKHFAESLARIGYSGPPSQGA